MVTINNIIRNLISKSALQLFSLLRASNYHYKNGPVIVDNITIKKIHKGIFIIVIIHSKLKRWVINIYFIIGYSTVKIWRVSDQCWCYYNFRNIKQQKLHLLIFYIKCGSVVWEHILSAHGEATAENGESLGNFFWFLSVFTIIIMSSWKSGCGDGVPTLNMFMIFMNKNK